MRYARSMTRYLCAPDSFKESLTAMEAARAMAQGIENADHDAEVRCLPMADGGEGTARALVDATGGSMRAVPVHDPLGRPVEGHFGLLADGTTAVVETAEASGLALLEAKERNPLIASSYGTGELMLAAVRSGAKRIIVGLGGSATNDAGAGLLQALGVRLLDKNGNDLAHGGAALANLTTIDISTMDPALKNVAITAACDVTNPLTGPTGASAVFGPQKGASKDDVATLDAALAHFAQVIDSQLGVAVNDVPGAGAAGGIGAALKGFLNAEFRPGIAIVIEQSGLDAAAQWADVVFTGEGSIDFQTKFGKTPAGVAETAKRHGKPVIAVAGHIGTGIDELHEVGIDAVFGIAPGAASLSELLADAAANVTRTTEQIVRTLQL
ncbi:glycerate kinase [Bifidobacterium longum subsp. infantis CCUG 52486]|uniref:Glycerate kinase n=1 Tax=Bifidobacterium longum subsp. infantis CCUG 52486 TaxID=537937 RepID=C5EAS0_BIFLI|nr:glycerate kinase [Bifidobacterium longum subsp. infantis CCUG 52486]